MIPLIFLKLNKYGQIADWIFNLQVNCFQW
jgi:hypothetical protein